MRHGGEGVAVHRSARAVRHAERACIRIHLRDNDQGISESDAAKISTLLVTTAQPSGGTGLGLSIVQELVVAHHGTITLEPSSREFVQDNPNGRVGRKHP